MRSHFSLSCAFIVVTLFCAFPGVEASTGPPTSQDVAPLLGVTDLELIEVLPHGDETGGWLWIEVPLPGGERWTMEIQPHSLRADGFQVLADVGSGVLVPQTAPPINTWRGTILEEPDSRVRAFFDGARLRAMIWTPAATWTIQPVEDVGFVGHPALHALYEGSAIIPTDFECGVTTLDPKGGSSGSSPMGLTGLEVTEIGIDADFEYYQINGSSVGNTVSDIETIMNLVEGVYDNPGIDILYEISTIVVRTVSSDPYSTTSPGGLLNQFFSAWNTQPESFIQADVAHLFTGKNLDGSVIGIASLSAICVNNHYGLSQSRFTSNFNSRTALTAHELGHNWNATHCDSNSDCRIMCSGLGGCNGINPLIFGASASSQIASYRNSRTCLTADQLPLDPPFLEEWTSSTFDPSNWTYRYGASISTQAGGEPSLPYAVQLNAGGSQDYRDDDLRSNEIDLNGTNSPTVQFFTQHDGVESGEVLVVEYRSSSLSWVELTTITSDGIDQTSFSVHLFSLPLNARHSGFRLRFSPEVNQIDDHWFVDDISVTDGPPPVTDPPTILDIQPPSGPTNGGTLVTITGTDFANDAQVFFGVNELVNVVWISANELRGTTPPGNPGFTNVVISQLSGSDLLAPGFLYTVEVVRVEDVDVAPGGSTTVDILADHETTLVGWSLAVDHDASLILVDSVSQTGTASAGADFFDENIDNTTGTAGGWWTAGVVLDFFGVNVVPPAAGTVLLKANYSVSDVLPPGYEIPIDLVTGVGGVDNLLVDPQGNALVPTLQGGTVTVVSGTTFIRGDGNRDGLVNIGDGIFALAYLFSGQPATCEDALDGNDDGQVNVADAVFLLSWLFNSGTEPPAPFPDAGLDPTADPLDCVL